MWSCRVCRYSDNRESDVYCGSCGNPRIGGYAPDSRPSQCGTCRGRRSIPCPICHGTGDRKDIFGIVVGRCGRCFGDGIIPCPIC